MQTKREVLKTIAKQGSCEGIKCFDCPYYEGKCPNSEIIKRIGAMAILRMFPEKKNPLLSTGTKIKFSNGDIATVTKVECGDICFYSLVFENGYKVYIDYLIGKTWEVVE